MSIYIYALVCPVTNEIRYIGKANNPTIRLYKHIQASKVPQNYTQRWIASLLREGLMPALTVLYEISNGEDWRVVERRYIAEGISSGLRLTNTSAGGEGVEILDPATEEARIRKITAAWQDEKLKAKHSSRIKQSYADNPHLVEELRIKSKKQWLDPTYAKKVSDAVRAAYSSDEARAAQSERSRRAHQNPQTEIKRAESQRANWAHSRERRIAALKIAQLRPEVKARKSEILKERHRNDPSYREKLQASLRDPELIKRRNAAISAGHQRRNAALKAKAK